MKTGLNWKASQHHWHLNVKFAKELQSPEWQVEKIDNDDMILCRTPAAKILFGE